MFRRLRATETGSIPPSQHSPISSTFPVGFADRKSLKEPEKRSMSAPANKSTFELILIKPTHYDDDGYPITWLRSHIPSNTLAALYGLGETAASAGRSVPTDIVTRAFDETNTRIRPDRIIADLRRRGRKGLICLVGVQTNQFPQAVDLARQFIKAGLPVALGGFHVSGCLSMLPVLPTEIEPAMDMGTIFAGEAEEGRLDEILLGAWNGTLKPLYNYMDNLPGLEGAPTPCGIALAATRAAVELRSRPRLPVPMLVLHHHQRAGPQEPFPARRRSRGDRPRTTAGHRRSSSPTTTWPATTLGGLLRPPDRAQGERGHRGLADHPGRHAMPSHSKLHPRALGRRPRVHRARNINPDNLLAAKKRQNKITEYRKMLQAWHNSGASTWQATSWVPATRAIHPARHGMSRSCRSTFSSCSSSPRCRARGPPDAVEAGRGWTRPTSTMCTTAWSIIPDKRRRVQPDLSRRLEDLHARAHRGRGAATAPARPQSRPSRPSS
jgi:hypothetical protein